MSLKLPILQIHNLMDHIAMRIHQYIKLLKNSFLNFRKIQTKVSVTTILLISKRSEIRKTVSNFFQKIMDFLATLIILMLNVILHQEFQMRLISIVNLKVFIKMTHFILPLQLKKANLIFFLKISLHLMHINPVIQAMEFIICILL